MKARRRNLGNERRSDMNPPTILKWLIEAAGGLPGEAGINDIRETSHERQETNYGNRIR